MHILYSALNLWWRSWYYMFRSEHRPRPSRKNNLQCRLWRPPPSPPPPVFQNPQLGNTEHSNYLLETRGTSTTTKVRIGCSGNNAQNQTHCCASVRSEMGWQGPVSTFGCNDSYHENSNKGSQLVNIFLTILSLRLFPGNSWAFRLIQLSDSVLSKTNHEDLYR